MPPAAKNPKYALEKWYSTFIEKTVDDIDVNDVYRMIGQNVLIDLGVEKAIQFLKEDPLAGELYDGQFLELLYELDRSVYADKVETLTELTTSIMDNLDDLGWIGEEDAKEYTDLLEKFIKKLGQN
ncbi:contact-dependent growth inhibition system immunity protein [Numidum massiliense]|uniref:contact-dependent growth inhibition system immunity protein n=1 Tax=Numidum massiliense TaxID=1522315 RepID=UPI0006D550AD|nr:contact-dependent growth inhibition system immunity protein [Numidum massiliense]